MQTECHRALPHLAIEVAIYVTWTRVDLVRSYRGSFNSMSVVLRVFLHRLTPGLNSGKYANKW